MAEEDFHRHGAQEQVEKMANAFEEFPKDIMKSLPGQRGQDQRSEEDDQNWIDGVAKRYEKEAAEDDDDEDNEANKYQCRHRFPQDDLYKDFAKGEDSGSTTDTTKGESGKDQRSEEGDQKWMQDMEDEYAKEAAADGDDSEANNTQGRHRFPQDRIYEDFAKGGDSGSAKDDSKAEGQTQNPSKKAEGEGEDYEKWIQDVEDRYVKEAAEDDDDSEAKNTQRHSFPQGDLYKDFAKVGDSGST